MSANVDPDGLAHRVTGGFAAAFGYAGGLALLGGLLAWVVPEAGGR